MVETTTESLFDRVKSDTPRLVARQLAEKHAKKIGHVLLGSLPGGYGLTARAIAPLLPTVGTILAALTPKTTAMDYLDDIVFQELFKGIADASEEGAGSDFTDDIGGIQAADLSAALRKDANIKNFNRITRISDSLSDVEKDRFDHWFERLDTEQSEKLFAYLEGASDEEVKRFISKHPNDMNARLEKVELPQTATPFTYIHVRRLVKQDEELAANVESFLKHLKRLDKENFKKNEKKFWDGVVRYLRNPDDFKFVMEWPHEEILDHLHIITEPAPTLAEAYAEVEKLWAEGTTLRKAFEKVREKMPTSREEVKNFVVNSAVFQTVDNALADDGKVDNWLKDRRAKAQARIDKAKRRR